MICITLNDLYYVEWIELGWMIFTALNHLYYVKWFALHGMSCTTLKDLYKVEWFSLRWKISTTLKDFYYVERFVQRWKICTTLNYSECNGWFADFHNVELFGLRYISEYRFFNPKMAGGTQFEPPVVFWKMYLLKKVWNLVFLWLLMLS